MVSVVWLKLFQRTRHGTNKPLFLKYLVLNYNDTEQEYIEYNIKVALTLHQIFISKSDYFLKFRIILDG